MQLHLAKDLNDLSRKMAYWLIENIQSTLQKQNQYTWALSGGSTPLKFYELLASPYFKEKIPWKKLHLFWGDERGVPSEDSRNNGKMVREALLNQVPVPQDQIHYIRTDIDPEKSANEYESLLKEYFADNSRSFDLVMLGMGDDGHTLSLFPGTEVVHEQKKWVKSFFLESEKIFRITLTSPIVNRSSAVAFLVSGHKKCAALKGVLEGPFQPNIYPSQIIRPTSGNLHWFVDQAAAGTITKK